MWHKRHVVGLFSLAMILKLCLKYVPDIFSCNSESVVRLLLIFGTCVTQWRILESPGGQRTPTFLSGGSRIGLMLWPPVLTPCWCHFFRFIYWLWTETVVVDQVLLWFRPTLILSRIPDYNVCVNVNRLNWCDHCKKSMTVRYDVIQSRALSVEV